MLQSILSKDVCTLLNLFLAGNCKEELENKNTGIISQSLCSFLLFDCFKFMLSLVLGQYGSGERDTRAGGVNYKG